MRFSETNYTDPGQLDFTPREREVGIWKILPAFLVVIALLLLLLLAPETIGSQTV